MHSEFWRLTITLLFAMQYYSTTRKKGILPFTSLMDLEQILVGERSWAEKDSCCMISLI